MFSRYPVFLGSPLLSVSLASVPILSALITVHAVLNHLEQVGVGSEEIFRGDRLPVLPFPDQT
jgi:hypothetical protein